uniref:Canopy FGF signaling regulator 4 n=1 Tax=Scleropages formosus TaxID=113540 RepID=A0A8C9SAU8_SCLFO
KHYKNQWSLFFSRFCGLPALLWQTKTTDCLINVKCVSSSRWSSRPSWTRAADPKRFWRWERCWTLANASARSSTTLRKWPLRWLSLSLTHTHTHTHTPEVAFVYDYRETRLTEAIDNICEGILQYSIHAERPGSLRYAKGTSQTMTTLKNLVNKGVKVELGLPYELWDEPSVEVADMKKQCETMLEQYEDVVEEWYFHHQEERLEKFLCEAHVLKGSDKECLEEVWQGNVEAKGSEEDVTSEGDDAAETHDPGEL